MKYLAILILLVAFGCKSKNVDVRQNQAVVAVTEPFLLGVGETDSLLAERFRTYENHRSFKSDSLAPYYAASVFDAPGLPFKIINLFGEHSGGATYTSFAQTHLLTETNPSRLIAEGETFKITTLAPNQYLFYVDTLGKLRNIYCYKVSITNDSLSVTPTEDHGPYLFGLINNKKETPDDLPNISHHQQDKSGGNQEDYVYDLDQQFLSRNINGLVCTLYVRHQFGDEQQKILRVTTDEGSREITLAMCGGDADYYAMASEFVNDSLFVQTLVERQTILDQEELMGYAFDSTLTWLRYNQRLELDTIKKEHFRYQQHHHSKNNQPLRMTQSIFSPVFTVNKTDCFWETALEWAYDNNRRRLPATPPGRQLKNAKTGKILLRAQPGSIPPEQIWHTETAGFTDWNGDGHTDICIPNREQSTQGASFYDCYLFNPKTGEYAYSKLFSGPVKSPLPQPKRRGTPHKKED